MRSRGKRRPLNRDGGQGVRSARRHAEEPYALRCRGDCGTQAAVDQFGAGTAASRGKRRTSLEKHPGEAVTVGGGVAILKSAYEASGVPLPSSAGGYGIGRVPVVRQRRDAGVNSPGSLKQLVALSPSRGPAR